jgi:signal transduction histidine kinase
MATALRVLLIEDSEVDCQLLLRLLRRGGYEPHHTRVETLDAIHQAFERETWDVVISDYSLPKLDAPRALAAIQALGFDVPFIIVSGTVDEETAVEAMRAGAHDFLAKTKLARLIPVIARELNEASGRAERRRMQEQLLVSDRLASLGTLAAGVAHEINNPLAAVLANVEIVLEDIDAVLAAAEANGWSDAARAAWTVERLPELVAPLRDIQEAALRVREVSRDLKVFSRGDENRRTAVDIREVLESALRMAHNEIRHRARLVREYADIPPVDANQSRLGQVFLNLLVNAAQALPDGDADHHEIRIVTRRVPPDRVVVEVHDTGHGIPASILPRVFDPFFTTKPIGVGTGLGLGICYRIVKELGGEIDVESREGHGTTFRVSLPVSTSPVVESTTPANVATPRPIGRRARILVVDDDPIVCAALRRLFAADHDIEVLEDARAARDLVVGGASFDVLLCDLLMPELTGVGLYEELRRHAPEMARRMVFMTGGAFTEEARNFLAVVDPPVVDKPFDLAALRALVETLVG